VGQRLDRRCDTATAGRARYAAFYQALSEFAFTHFADPEHGDWYITCYPDGSVHNPFKGSTYKTAFHPVEMSCDLIRYLTPVE
jgi:mannose/cellobiose epimerase-like protein (N-acyl-D-glucosamine 2-epimerase family)